MIDHLARTAKALAALVVCAAAYLVGIMAGDQGLGDVTTVQWLGLVVFVGAAYGITYAVPNRTLAPERNEHGRVNLTPSTWLVDTDPGSRTSTHFGRGLAKALNESARQARRRQ